MKNKAGQGIVEIIFSIGVIAVVITGVVSLMINVLKTKTNSLKRERASEMSNVVVENLVGQKTLDEKGGISGGNFWSGDVFNSIKNGVNLSGTLPEFEGYVYNVGFSQVIDDQKCKRDDITCAEARINIFWNDGEDSLSVSRFFYKGK